MSKPSRIDAIGAKLMVETTSRMCVRIPLLKRAVFGGDYPGRIYTTLEEMNAAEVDWLEAKGNKKSGRLPRNYRSAAATSVPVDRWRHQLNQYPGSVPAGAFAFGSAVLVTEIAPHELDDDRVELGHAEAIFRVGKGALKAAIGVSLPEDQVFIPNAKAAPFHVFSAAEIAERYPNAILL